MNFILPITFIIVLLTNIFVLFEVHTFWLSSIFALVSLLIVPGILLLIILRIKSSSFWETISLVVGLSISFIMFTGLLINELLPILGISEPLAPMPVLVSFDLLLLILFYLARIHLGDFRFNFMPLKLKKYDLPLTLVTVIFPILAVLGAISLNNGGTNLFTMILLGGIGAYILALILFHSKISPAVFPTALYFIGLSLLLMTSLRSWYVFGHDVQMEYFVFQLTKVRPFWNIDFYKDAYNACLSITILPTILSNFLMFNDIYIYKVVFQIIFAICPVVVYLFFKKYAAPLLAFIATFYFLSFPTFLNDMTMLNRQEIGFLFFSLMIYVLFKRNIASRQKLLFIFSFSLVVSHYSTTYVAVGLLMLMYLTHLVIKTGSVNKIFEKYIAGSVLFKSANHFSHQPYLSLTLLGSLLLFTFFWNSLLTKTSSGLTSTIIQTITNISTVFRQDNKSADITYSLFFSPRVDNTEFIKSHLEELVIKAKNQPAEDFYAPGTYADYQPEIIPNDQLPLTGFGRVLKRLSIDVFQFNYWSRQFFAKMIQVLIIIGLVGLFIYKTKKKYDIGYVIACFISVFFIVLMIILPQLSLSYGLLRLFQQLLMLLGLPLLIGNLLLFRFMKETKALYLVGVLAILFFLSLSGFVSMLTGGYYPQVNLSNMGLYYDLYYSQKAEIASMSWLRSFAPGTTVQADTSAMTKLFTFGNIYSRDGTIPQTIQKSAYVYLDQTNVSGRTVLSIERALMIRFPLKFLDNNKDLIYNNGFSRIYK